MKKVLFTLTLLVSLFMLGISANAEITDKEQGYISVSQSDTGIIAPNQVEIFIRIDTSNKLLKQAVEDNKKIANKVYTSLKALLGTEGYLKTDSYTVQPQYIYTKENKKIIDKYLVINTLFVLTKKIDLISKIIDTAIEQGATSAGDLQFKSTNYNDSCDNMLAELTKKAYSKANIIAKSINSQVTGVKSINVSCNSENNYRPMYGFAKASMEDSAAVSTPIESGKLKINANVDASFYVK